MTRVMFVGDTHGNPVHFQVMSETAKELNADLIIQVGDFGYVWNPERVRLLEAQGKYLPCPLYFLSGNHENFDLLKQLGADEDGDSMVEVASNIWHLPRGYCFSIKNKKFLAVGGAVSIDRGPHAKGLELADSWPKTTHRDSAWWPEEEITDEQVERACAHGEVDVLLTHDASSWLYGKLQTYLNSMGWVPKAEKWCNENRERISRVVDSAKPKLHVHGHYHFFYEETIDGVETVGLNQSGDWYDAYQLRVL